MTLTGLLAKSELNGKAAFFVLGFDEASQRYMIELERQTSWDKDSIQLKIKPANLLLSTRPETVAELPVR